MKQPDKRRMGDSALRNRLSRLSEASLRINESLDLETVLQEVVDNARALTDSRYGVITTLDDSGEPPDFVTSGMTPDEHHSLESFTPDGLQVYRYFSGLKGPLRFRDYQSYLASLGLPDFCPVQASSFLVAPIRHLGESIGTIALARQEADQEFTQEDEDTLVMFASQAALVIANARRYQQEQRARADLQTLVDTSPIGVVLFDVKNSRLASLNREAKRIVGDLLDPDWSWEDIFQRLRFRRADGREVSMEEFTIYEALRIGETVRAEDITMELPDGRSVTAVINATPIRAKDGDIEAFVVTMQDLTAVEELHLLRTEFLAMISHELRTPLTSIRGSATTLLDEGSALDPAEMRQFHRIILEQADHMRGLISDLLEVARIETGTLSVTPEPSDVAVLVDEARKTFLSTGGKHNLEINVAPDLPQVLADRRRIVQVLVNLLSNAARQSPEFSAIKLNAVLDDPYVSISVSDRGRGISAERLPLLFRKFSRQDDDPGDDTGLGLAICKGIVEAHGGRISADSEGTGLGARFTFTIPVVEQPEGETRLLTARGGKAAREHTRVLAIDDDPQVLRYIRHALSRAGYEPIVTADPRDVQRLVAEEAPDLVLLDLMLPGTNGVELMHGILETTDVPVIFISAYGQEEYVTRALDAGAVDYVVKPFASSELAARIRAALRKQSGIRKLVSPDPFVLGTLSIDYGERRVAVGGRSVELTATEYAVLFELSVNAGIVLTHEDLLRRVWRGRRFRGSGLVRTIVNRLRRKLGDDVNDPTYIFTAHRVGYRMAKPLTQE